MPQPEIVLYERDGCHLCEEARVLLDDMLGPTDSDASTSTPMTTCWSPTRTASRCSPSTASTGSRRPSPRPDVRALGTDDPAPRRRRWQPRLAGRHRRRWRVLLGVLAFPLLRGAPDGASAHCRASRPRADGDGPRRPDLDRWPMPMAGSCGSTSGPPAASRAEPRCRPCSDWPRRTATSCSSSAWTGARRASRSPDFADRYGVTYPILLDPTPANYYRWAGHRWAAAALLRRRRGDRAARGHRSARPGPDGGDPRRAACGRLRTAGG